MGSSANGLKSGAESLKRRRSLTPEIPNVLVVASWLAATATAR